MKRIVSLSLIAGLALLGAVGWPTTVFAAKPPSGGSATTIGYDVSYPQCGTRLPADKAFAIVGVNGGLATTVNECLAEQLRWASSSSGAVPAQPKAQLYVNTANPGEVIEKVTTWPTTGQTPYGVCDGTNSAACSWQYGWERANVDVNTFFKPAAFAATVSQDPKGYIWWLDVETTNTWQSGSEAALARNRAALEGMTAYFTSFGATVGVYSTNYQWGQITGAVPSDSNLYRLNSWMAGARTLRGAQDNCRNQPFTQGGRVVLTQYVSKGLDHNHSCI